MTKIAIVYGSTTDKTKEVAQQIATKLASFDVAIFDVAKLKADQLAPYATLIFGTSTWGFGDLQDDWDGFLPQLAATDLTGKTVALFGLGDSYAYPDTFVDGMSHIYQVVKDKGCKLVGGVSPEGYAHSSSNSVVDGLFVGLPLDEENESDQTENRLSAWVEAVSPSFS